MDWDHLPALLAVSRTGSMAEAARQLSVNSTTIGRRIDALEEAMGARLVETGRSGAHLTAAGESVLRSIEQMEGLAFDVERTLLGGDASLSGTLRISTTDTIAHYEPSLFVQFNERYPDVELEVVTSYREHSLLQREADVALRWTNQPDESLFGRKLARAEYALYGARRLVTRVGRRARLDRFPWLAWSRESGARVTEKWMVREVPEARIVLRFDTALAMHAAVIQGAGIAFLPRAFGDGQRGLVRLRQAEPDFGYDLWCLTHPDLSQTARVRAFLSHAGEYFAVAKDRYAGRSRKRAR